MNALHPFRDGNGRTQRILFEHIVLNCGYSISWESVSRQEWIDANIEGFSGRNAFSRYENGKTKPPLALVKLLKVLDRHPDLLDEVKAA